MSTGKTNHPMDRKLTASDYDLIEAGYARLLFSDTQTGESPETLTLVADSIGQHRDRAIRVETLRLTEEIDKLTDQLHSAELAFQDFQESLPKGDSLVRAEARANGAEAEVKELKLQLSKLVEGPNTEGSVAWWFHTANEAKVERDALRVQAAQLREALIESCAGGRTAIRHARFDNADETTRQIEESVDEADSLVKIGEATLAQTESLASLCVCGKDELEQLRKDRERLEAIRLIALKAVGTVIEVAGEWRDHSGLEYMAAVCRAHACLATGRPDPENMPALPPMTDAAAMNKGATK